MGGAMNQINAVTIGKLIAAHREGDEEKFKTYVDFIADAYEQQELQHCGCRNWESTTHLLCF